MIRHFSQLKPGKYYRLYNRPSEPFEKFIRCLADVREYFTLQFENNHNVFVYSPYTKLFEEKGISWKERIETI